MSGLDLDKLRDNSQRTGKAFITVDDLKQVLSEQAQQLSKEVSVKRESLRQLEDDQRFRNTIEQIPLRCEIASLQGEQSAEVFSIWLEDTLGQPWGGIRERYNPTDPKNLLGVGKRVWDYLKENGLSPTINGREYDEDYGKDSRCRIVISW